ncbi:uncharacterized protein LOC119946081 [Tachyglossus aculeatus]|uniref:uncharacterized protein LOC119946081 n=1 Tax=Tachyglossus aculeatus TaxID=9261 RepID=UPI0018F38D9C|nr:uncharacterized protein LOC119946081 [Tachyglossus aculeatus]XP_038623403.1 uncharacterized protein LOC119946081 [Tachyglossus aculeatus]XP_038623404.1 uncharacterized protein LOC119946081 [Tachyglossus aculeatus]XP_038623405.1 uncharacterized protein LOC119946081 [Tachyglossus aculeatus]
MANPAEFRNQRDLCPPGELPSLHLLDSRLWPCSMYHPYFSSYFHPWTSEHMCNRTGHFLPHSYQGPPEFILPPPVRYLHSLPPYPCPPQDDPVRDLHKMLEAALAPSRKRHLLQTSTQRLPAPSVSQARAGWDPGAFPPGVPPPPEKLALHFPEPHRGNARIWMTPKQSSLSHQTADTSSQNEKLQTCDRKPLEDSSDIFYSITAVSDNDDDENARPRHPNEWDGAGFVALRT